MFSKTQEPLDGYDIAVLDKALDRVKGNVFLSSSAAFLGPLMCSLEFIWEPKVKTAGTDGLRIFWAPKFFMGLPEKVRETVLVHELWHVAYMHMVRTGDRDKKIFNYACDIAINNDLEDQGYSFETVEDCWKDQRYRGQNAEAIYDDLMKNAKQIPNPAWGKGPSGAGNQQNQQGNSPSQGDGDADGDPQDGDMYDTDSPVEKQTIINNVVRAAHSAKMSNKAGSIPGALEEIINEFLKPKIDWKVALQTFFTDMIQEDYTWARPNRRYQDMYLPSPDMVEGRLGHLIYYLDTSGSITTKDVIRFNSELKYIKDTLSPEKLTVVQFDTQIQSEIDFDEFKPFEKIMVKGRGGTSLKCVRDHIKKYRPQAAIIFSDLYVPKMTPDPKVPIIWVVIGNKNAQVDFGKMIHITS
jgi:predicted metal-dependent peptidase